MMQWKGELDEDDIDELEKASEQNEVPRSWRPGPLTTCAIEGEEDTAEQKDAGPEKLSRTDRMIESMMEKEGKADLTKPGAWGRFAHAAVQDAMQEAEPATEIEKSIDVIKENRTSGKGRIDVVTDEGILEIKTTDLDRFSDSELVRELDGIARQVEGYQGSPEFESKPEATVFFEFPPENQERQEFVETFFQQRGIQVIWGRD